MRQCKETSETVVGDTTTQGAGSERDNLRGQPEGTILTEAASGNILGEGTILKNTA